MGPLTEFINGLAYGTGAMVLCFVFLAATLCATHKACDAWGARLERLEEAEERAENAYIVNTAIDIIDKHLKNGDKQT